MDKKKAIVVGLGETGMPLWQVLDAAYPGEVLGYDPKREGFNVLPSVEVEFLNICLPWGEGFVPTVWEYQALYRPRLTIIHSTVPVGTTAKITEAVHSPILGKHGRMREELMTYDKWIGGSLAAVACDFFERARMRCTIVPTPEETELMKLMCLAKYGLSIAFAFYQEDLCRKFGVPYERVLEWDRNYNNGVFPSYHRPMIQPDSGGKIGGHCVVPGSKLLNAQFPNPMLEEILRHG